MSRQTVAELMVALVDDVDCSEGMSEDQILDLPINILTGSGEYRSLLSVYVSEEDDGTKVLCIDVGE